MANDGLGVGLSADKRTDFCMVAGDFEAHDCLKTKAEEAIWMH